MNNIPKKYQKIIDDLNKEYNFLYMDSLVLIMMWRKEKKLEWKNRDGLGSKAYSLFRKFTATIIEHFYERNIPLKERTRKYLGLGFDFADWLLKTPLDYKLPIPHHNEINE